jgi:hypothetical protein
MGKTLPFEAVGSPRPSADECRAICAAALALATRADKAGLSGAAYLLDMAAMAIGDEFGFFERERPSSEQIRIPTMPSEPQALLAWAERHIMDWSPHEELDARVEPRHVGPGARQRRNLFRKLPKL